MPSALTSTHRYNNQLAGLLGRQGGAVSSSKAPARTGSASYNPSPFLIITSDGLSLGASCLPPPRHLEQASIDSNMNEMPTYAHFSLQNEEDLSFGMFDVPTTHHGFHQSMHPESFADAFAIHGQTPPSDHLSCQDSQFEILSRNMMASYHQPARPPTPYQALHPKFESPSLSSGSSSTPETNGSQYLITLDNPPTVSQAPGDECDAEEFDEDASPVLRSARKKLGRRRSATAAKENAMGSAPEKEGKRKHFLQRNRVAAMKCRKKKKEWVSDLEETKSGLESQNAHLHMELDGLADEASRIRAELMVHANCNDSNIDKWIENEAKRFVIGTSERYDQILAHFSPTQGMSRPQEALPASDFAGGGSGGGPSLISPLATPSQMPPSPAFYTPNAPAVHTPGCYAAHSQEAASFARGLAQGPGPDEEPDYDGMSISMYDHPVG